MKRVMISTTGRHKSPNAASGHYYIVEIETFQVVQRSEIIEPPYREFDTNPRGGVRGGKGLWIQRDKIFLSNSSAIFIYDRNWKPLTTISHPTLGGIHDLCVQGNTIWVTSSRNDLLLSFDFEGNLLNYIDFRRLPQVFQEIRWKPKPYLSEKQIRDGSIDFRDPRTHDPNVSDASHINSVDLLPNGDLLVSLGLLINTNFSYWLLIKKELVRIGLWKKWLAFNRFISRLLLLKKKMHSDLILQPASGSSAVIRITKDLRAVPCLVLKGITVPSHSVRTMQDGSAVYLNTMRGEIIHFEPETGQVISGNVIGRKFLRGVRQLEDGTLLVGDNNLLYRYDLFEKKILATLQLSPDPDEAVFDLLLLPEDIDLPPLSFLELQSKWKEEGH
jgi:hypothetical protein